MTIERTREIKRAQKESLIFKELSQLLLQLSMDEPALGQLYINRVKLSPDKSSCTIYFYSPLGEEDFRKKLGILILYKPSLRTALAKTLASRYTPELIFAFDKQFEKQQRIEALIDKVKAEDKL